MTRHVLQISDCHLVMPGTELLGVDTQASLEAVLKQATQHKQPDAVIASGDLAHDPTRDNYLRFLATVRRFTAAPLLCLPGNHDILGVMQTAALPMDPIEVGSWTLTWLDSHEDDQPRALVEQADVDAARNQIEAAATPHVLLATHHPLVAVNCPWLDMDRIQNAAELLQSLSECSSNGGTAKPSKLKGCVFGHAHQQVEAVVALNDGAIPVFGVPSSCFQFAGNSVHFATTDEWPGLRWLELSDDGSIRSTVVRVPFTIAPRTFQ